MPPGVGSFNKSIELKSSGFKRLAERREFDFHFTAYARFFDPNRRIGFVHAVIRDASCRQIITYHTISYEGRIARTVEFLCEFCERSVNRILAAGFDGVSLEG